MTLKLITTLKLTTWNCNKLHAEDMRMRSSYFSFSQILSRIVMKNVITILDNGFLRLYFSLSSLFFVEIVTYLNKCSLRNTAIYHGLSNQDC